MKGELLEEVIAAEALRLLALPGVVGVAEGLDAGRSCIVVYVTDVSAAMIPADLRGYPVVVRKSGEIRAL
jgi:hypothetical protein